MKRIYLSAIFALLAMATRSQDIQMTRTGKINFHAGTALEDIDAANNEVTSILNKKTGEIVFNVLVKSFHLRRALMEEHFNENYMESDKYPKSTFNGKISNLSAVSFDKDGTYKVTVDGDITIHNVTKKISVPATLTVAGGKISATCEFKLKPEEFNIQIPGIVSNKIAKEVNVVIDCKYEPRS